ncbi:hypothetical protein [Caballeronia mineralivorans]|uniref:hypothetical protein n=1 Tax=Caballeronia mineralivorans TaxID=2010198 RepID=UPI0023F56214|nr:hypothetical protein [Caballeronia mineralivorans]
MKPTLEVRQRLHLGMAVAVNYVGDDNCAGRAAENFTALAILKSNAGLVKDRKKRGKPAQLIRLMPDTGSHLFDCVAGTGWK